MLTPNDVFTPGRIPLDPTNVYSRREKEEKDLKKNLNRSMGPIIYGEYGVGKTSMALNVVKNIKSIEDHVVRINCRPDMDFLELKNDCIRMSKYLEASKITRVHGDTKTSEVQAHQELSAKIAKAGSQFKKAETESNAEQIEFENTIKTISSNDLIRICEDKELILLVDELHQANEDFKKNLVSFIKTYGNSSCRKFKMILLGTTSDANELVSRDFGIDRLISEIKLNSMTDSEVKFIITKGMSDLGITISETAEEKLIDCSVGSPSIVQFLSLETAEIVFEKTPRRIDNQNVEEAINKFMTQKESRMNRIYHEIVETTGETKYRKRILQAMALSENEYVTMEFLVNKISELVGKKVPNTSISGPLRDLKTDRYKKILKDVDRGSQGDKILNCTAFREPSFKAFVRLKMKNGE